MVPKAVTETLESLRSQTLGQGREELTERSRSAAAERSRSSLLAMRLLPNRCPEEPLPSRAAGLRATERKAGLGPTAAGTSSEFCVLVASGFSPLVSGCSKSERLRAGTRQHGSQAGSLCRCQPMSESKADVRVFAFHQMPLDYRPHDFMCGMHVVAAGSRELCFDLTLGLPRWLFSRDSSSVHSSCHSDYCSSYYLLLWSLLLSFSCPLPPVATSTFTAIIRVAIRNENTSSAWQSLFEAGCPSQLFLKSCITR